MNVFQNGAVAIARILTCVWFLPEGIEKIIHYGGTVGYMAAHGVPGWLLPLVIATEIICAIMILLGWKTRLFALLLAGYTFLTVILFHIPAADAAAKIVQMAELVDGAGFLVLFAFGAGDWSLDHWRTRRRARSGRVSGILPSAGA